MEPQNKKANFRMAQAYLRTGKIELAQEKLQELAKSDPGGTLVIRKKLFLRIIYNLFIIGFFITKLQMLLLSASWLY